MRHVCQTHDHTLNVGGFGVLQDGLDAFGQPLHTFNAFTASVCNLNPTSRGTVQIQSPLGLVALGIDDPAKTGFLTSLASIGVVIGTFIYSRVGRTPVPRLLLIEFALLTACATGLYFYVPNTRVQWQHALAGGLVSSIGVELGKKVLTLYLAQMPTYSAIYGAFAAVPILLVWIVIKNLFLLKDQAVISQQSR